MRKIITKIEKAFRIVFNRIFRLIKFINKRKKLSTSISGVFILVLIIYLFFSLREDTQLIINSLSYFSSRNLVFSFLLYGINFYIFFEIWRVILKSFNYFYPREPILKVFSSTYLAKFVPSPIFLYVSRMSQLEKIGISPKKTIATTALEFVFQVVVGFMILGFINIRADQPITLLWIFVILICFGILLNPKLFNSKNYNNFLPLNFDKQKISLIIVFEFITWIIGGLFFFFILKNFSDPITHMKFSNVWLIWIVANISSLIGSHLLGGLGLLREFTIVLMLQNHFSSPLAIVTAATVRVMLIFCGVLWAIIFYFLALLLNSAGNQKNY